MNNCKFRIWNVIGVSLYVVGCMKDQRDKRRVEKVGFIFGLDLGWNIALRLKVKPWLRCRMKLCINIAKVLQVVLIRVQITMAEIAPVLLFSSVVFHCSVQV